MLGLASDENGVQVYLIPATTLPENIAPLWGHNFVLTLSQMKVNGCVSIETRYYYF